MKKLKTYDQMRRELYNHFCGLNKSELASLILALLTPEDIKNEYVERIQNNDENDEK